MDKSITIKINYNRRVYITYTRDNAGALAQVKYCNTVSHKRPKHKATLLRLGDTADLPYT